MSELPFTLVSYNQVLAEHRLMGSRCQSCGALHLPPRPICTACHAAQMSWEQLSGLGRLAGFSVIYSGLSAMSAAGYSRSSPYCSAIVHLAEGPSISAQVFGLDLEKPELIQIGTPVQVDFLQRGGSEGNPVVLVFKVLRDGQPSDRNTVMEDPGSNPQD